MYTVYSTNYEKALDTYDKLTKNKVFMQTLKEIEAKPECKGINMMGFLIKPVQKVKDSLN
jgi:hypothetical protein